MAVDEEKILIGELHTDALRTLVLDYIPLSKGKCSFSDFRNGFLVLLPHNDSHVI